MIDSIDNYVERVLKNNIGCTNEHACNIIVDYHPDRLLKILKCKHNKPSKWDLVVISRTIKHIHADSLYQEILKIYKNRKD